jgi:hypothetical protein
VPAESGGLKREALAQDPDDELRGATTLDERDRLVEVDVEPSCERYGVVARQADTHELGGAPALYAFDFGLDDFLCRSHSQ